MPDHKIVIVLLLQNATKKFGKYIYHPEIGQRPTLSKKIQTAVLKAPLPLLKLQELNLKINRPCHPNLYWNNHIFSSSKPGRRLHKEDKNCYVTGQAFRLSPERNRRQLSVRDWKNNYGDHLSTKKLCYIL